MSEPFANAVGVLKSIRYALLAGAMLAVLAAPQWSAAADGRAKEGSIVVAQQRVDPNESDQQKGKQKGQQKGEQKGQQGQPGQGQPGQQKQFGKQLPGGAGQQQGQQGGPGQPGGPPGQPPGGAGVQPQQKQFGKQSPGGAGQQQGQQGGSSQPGGPAGQQPGGAGGQPQQKQFGKQSPAGPGQQQGQQGGSGQAGGPAGQQPGGAGGQPQQKQFGKQSPTGPGQQQGQQGGSGQPGGPVGQQPGGPVGQQPSGPAGVGGQPKQFGKQTPGGGAAPQPQLGKQTPGQQPLPGGAQPPQGATGVANVDQLRSQRRERTEGGRTVIEEPGNRLILREGGRTVIVHDEHERFRRFAPDAQVTRRGSETLTIYERPGGIKIVNITDANGHLLRRVRREPDGREIVIIENRGPGFGTGVAVGLVAGAAIGIGAAVFLDLPPPVITIPRERYIVDVGVATPVLLYETLEAPPLVPIERAYTLDEIRYNVVLRDRMRRIDINTINFEFGSWEVAAYEYGRLAQIAESMQRILSRNPDEVFMIEGHTDAVGSEEDNLSLSDRRAESVAVILTQQYGISPENLVTQGYGKQFLKIPTLEANRENRRVAVRRITPLLRGHVAAR